MVVHIQHLYAVAGRRGGDLSIAWQLRGSLAEAGYLSQVLM